MTKYTPTADWSTSLPYDSLDQYGLTKYFMNYSEFSDDQEYFCFANRLPNLKTNHEVLLFFNKKDYGWYIFICTPAGELIHTLTIMKLYANYFKLACIKEDYTVTSKLFRSVNLNNEVFDRIINDKLTILAFDLFFNLNDYEQITSNGLRYYKYSWHENRPIRSKYPINEEIDSDFTDF